MQYPTQRIRLILLFERSVSSGHYAARTSWYKYHSPTTREPWSIKALSLKQIRHFESESLMATGSSPSVAFGALGTLLGYVGAEVASETIFTRLLWPQRYYNSRHLASLVALAALMPMGGPIHKAALAALDQFIKSGLNKGYCRGDMLGTAFYEDVKQTYVLRRGEEDDQDLQKEARNGLWIRVMRLVYWQTTEDVRTPLSTETRLKDEEAANRVTKLRAKRPLLWLRLGYDFEGQNRNSSCDGTRYSGSRSTDRSSGGPLIEENSEHFQKRVLLAIFISETISIGVGAFIGVHWRSPYSIWFLSPLVIKLLGLGFAVRRQALESKPQDTLSETESDSSRLDIIITEMSDFSKQFMLIEGPRHLVTQFYKHYGHPERYRRGLNGDRVREVVCLGLVIACILIFPAGLIAFVFAPQSIQWTWLGYQLYTTFAMHFFRFVDGATIGSTESELARALRKDKNVRFCDSEGTIFRAHLDLKIVDSVMDGRTAIEAKLKIAERSQQ